MFKRYFVAFVAFLARLADLPVAQTLPAPKDSRDEAFGPLVQRRNFLTDAPAPGYTRQQLSEAVRAATFQRTTEDFVAVGGYAMDSIQDFKNAFSMGGNGMSDIQLSYFGSQAFIGYQCCAMLAQNWLIGKACWVPARDAVRNGYDVTVNDGTDVGTDILGALRNADVRFNLTENLTKLVGFGRVFGIRVLLFDVNSPDPEYYEKPFNPDGITRGSYRGISQIDPYWLAPMLSGDAAANPTSKHFFEPTWWNINGKRYHRSHLIIFRGEEVPDLLKPTYLYGGLSVPQKIYERVYAAERMANEAPQLALTKRTKVRKVDLDRAIANQGEFEQRLQLQDAIQNNYGTYVIGLDEEAQQFDTSLTDLDTVIMTQYQLVAAAANMPVTKLLGTTPRGFNATGEYDEASYHEELESIQTSDLTPVLKRHYLLLIRSEIASKFKVEPFEIEISWKPLDAMTAKELAELNKTKAETDEILQRVGSIDGQDVRQRVTSDPDSGYSGLAMPEDEDLPPEDAAAVDSEAPATNAAMQNLTGKQFQGVARIIRNYSKGQLTSTQAAVMLRSGFSLGDDEIQQLLGEVAGDA